MGSGLPTPPRDDPARPYGVRKTGTGAKPTKPSHRTSKRASLKTHAHGSSANGPSHDLHTAPAVVAAGTQSSADARHKRVWKACERCRMKKTKCDGEFPCKRCKDDGLVCTAGLRRKTEYKNIPRGYAEVLENTQFALVATVHKLYAMLRDSQPWDLGEPELNDRGQPVIHDIASRLGCIRPNSDVDLPIQSSFPEDEAGLADLIAKLEAQNKENLPRTTRAGSSDIEASDLEHDYRKMAFGRANAPSSAGAASPQSLYTDIDARPGSATDFSPHSPALGPRSATAFEAWGGCPSASRPEAGAAEMLSPGPMATFGDGFLQQPGGTFIDDGLLGQGILESEFGILKQHVPPCANPEVMMGLGDPMIFSGYDPDILRM